MKRRFVEEGVDAGDGSTEVDVAGVEYDGAFGVGIIAVVTSGD